MILVVSHFLNEHVLLHGELNVCFVVFSILMNLRHSTAWVLLTNLRKSCSSILGLWRATARFTFCWWLSVDADRAPGPSLTILLHRLSPVSLIIKQLQIIKTTWTLFVSLPVSLVLQNHISISFRCWPQSSLSLVVKLWVHWISVLRVSVSWLLLLTHNSWLGVGLLSCLLPLLIEYVLTWRFLKVSLQVIIILLLAIVLLFSSCLENIVLINRNYLIVLDLTLVSATWVVLLERCLVLEVIGIVRHSLSEMHTFC